MIPYMRDKRKITLFKNCGPKLFVLHVRTNKPWEKK